MHLFCHECCDNHRGLRSFPTRRSSDLGSGIAGRRVVEFFGPEHFTALHVFDRSPLAVEFAVGRAQETRSESTRLNSSHITTSYAVFCLKKKTLRTTDSRYLTRRMVYVA